MNPLALFWELAAWVITRPRVSAWLIERAQRTPYRHITSADGREVYMRRWWLFNAYPDPMGGSSTPAPRHIRWLHSVRVHHICRPDIDRHLHDHPWDARTIVLRGWYTEERPWSALTEAEAMRADGAVISDGAERALYSRLRGHTGRLLFGQFHRISAVSPGGVWTLFITGRHRGTWGFEVDGRKVPWREYLGVDE